MAKEIANINLDPSALQKVLSIAAAGEDVGAYLDNMAGEDFGEDFGADDAKTLNALLTAAAGGEDFSGDDASELRRLMTAAAGAIPAARRWSRSRRSARPGARPGARRPNPSRSPARRPAAPNKTTARWEGASMPVTRDLSRVLSRRGPGEGPNTPLPLTSTAGQAIAANDVAVINLSPPKDYIVQGLHLQGEHAERLVIDSIVIEGDPLYAVPGSIPGGSFAPTSTRSNLPSRLCKGGRSIVVTLRNITGAAITAYGTFWGDEGDVSERANRAA